MSETSYPLYWIPLLPLAGAALNLLLGRQLGRRAVHLVACTTVGLACAVALVATFSQLYPLWQQVRGSGSTDVPRLVDQLGPWLSTGDLHVQLGLWLDPLSAVMVLVITFVGWLIHVYSTGYMAHEASYARFFGYLNLFTGAMLLLVLADNLVLLFVGWEGVGLCSYLLIGFWYDKDGSVQPGEGNATAGRKAFLVNRLGDCAFLLGLFLLFSSAGTLDIATLSTRAGALLAPVTLPVLGTASVAGAAGVLLFIGATGKSAQLPLYVWLPDAMAGPTPVSALIHAATMVTAGVYMVARLNFIYLLSPMTLGLIALVGGLTALYAATIALAQTDIKKVLAYSTISQLGYMFLAVGVGAFDAGIFHLFTHAFFKACLFLGAGAVIHALGGKQDLREMGGLKEALPLTHWTFLLATLALCGIPFWSGFFSKDEILWQAFSRGNPAWPMWLPSVLYLLALLAAFCTACYGFRLYYLAFTGCCRAAPSVQEELHEAPVRMTTPLLVLGAGATLFGVLGLPGLLGKDLNVVRSWLAPVFGQGAQLARSLGAETVHPRAVAHQLLPEAGLLLLSAAVALLGWLALARWLYRDGFSARVTQLVRRFPRVHHAMQRKYWVDEIYRALVLQPLRGLAWLCSDALDRFLIDFVAINGSAKLVDTAGRMVRALQDGNVQRYLVLLLLGVASLVYFFVGVR